MFFAFKKFKALVENQTERKIKKLRTDSGLEFCELEFIEFYAVNGIARHKTLVGKPQQNRVVEHINRTLLEKARCMLSNTGLWDRKAFWAEVVSAACYPIDLYILPLIFRFQKKFDQVILLIILC